MLFISDQFIIYEEHVSAPAKFVQPIQLADDLFGSLDARTVSEQGGDIAKVTVETVSEAEL